jgi:hypothetical protein
MVNGSEALVEGASDAGDSEDSALAEAARADGSGDVSDGPKERHECVVCGITTTSAAHLEVTVSSTVSLPQLPDSMSS